MSPAAHRPAGERIDRGRAPLSGGRILAVCAARVLLFATFMSVAATSPLLMADWRVSAAGVGAVVTSFTVGYAASLFGFAWGADHWGAKRMVLVSAPAAAVTSLAFGLVARDWSSAVLLYGLVGCAQGGVYTPLVMVLADEVAPDRLGNVMGWLIASTSVGYAASLAVSALGIGAGGWQLAFVLTGVLPAAGALLLVLALRPVANRVHQRPEGVRVRDEVARGRAPRLLVAGYTGHSWELLGMWAWIPAFLTAAIALRGADAAGATASGANLSGLLHLVGAAAALSMGRLSDRVGRGPVLVGLAAGGAAMSFAIGWLVHAPVAVLVGLAFAYAFLCLGDSPVLTTAISEVVRPGYLGAVLAWRGLVGFGAGALAPLAFGAVLDTAGDAGAGPVVAWGLAFAALGLGGTVAFACALALRRA